MNALERRVHGWVTDHPAVRIALVAAYQRVCSLAPRRDFVVEGAMRVQAGCFFGFHDRCPWSADDAVLAAHRFDPSLPMAEAEARPVEIVVLSADGGGEPVPVARTAAWNWQQGASLQWVGESRRLLLNDLSAGRPVARLIELDGQAVATWPHHVACVSHDGRLGLSYCFERLGRGLRGYGYRDMVPTGTQPEGLSAVDLRTGDARLLVSLDELAGLEAEASMEGAHHFVSHCLFAPGDGRFLFLHRWVLRSGAVATRMYTCGSEGDRLFRVPGTRFSHVAWRNAEEIVAYGRPPGRPIGFYLLGDLGDTAQPIAPECLTSDGHPQCTADGRGLLTDTYPDRARDQRLKLHDFTTASTTTLARLRIPFAYRYERRCDFHPRWSRDGGRICVDSAHNGVRSLYVLQPKTLAADDGAAS